MPLIASTASHEALEEIAEANGEGPRWYQLYWPNDDDIAASFVRRAEASGYSAIVLTVDNYVPGWKPRDLQQAYLPFLEGIGIAKYSRTQSFSRGSRRRRRRTWARRSAISSGSSRTRRSPGSA